MPLGSGWSKQEVRNIVEVFNALADKKQNLWPTLTILKMVASEPENLSLGQEVTYPYCSVHCTVTVHDYSSFYSDIFRWLCAQIQ